LVDNRAMRGCIPGLALLAACGRLGFDVVDPGGEGGVVVAPDHIAVTLDGSAGPIAGAYVAVERGGSFTVLQTDASGFASFAAAGPTTFHAGYKVAITDSWLLYSAIDVDPGTLVAFGARAGHAVERSRMSIVLPAFVGASAYAILGPSCIYDVSSASTTVNVAFATDCAGTPVQLVALEIESGEAGNYLDLGSVIVTDGATLAASGPWQPAAGYTASVTNLPAGANSASVDFQYVDSSRDERTLLHFRSSRTFAPSGALSVLHQIPPSANAVIIEAASPTAEAVSTWIDARSLAAGSNAIDASAMLPLVASVTPGVSPLSLRWSAPSTGTATTIIAGGTLISSTTTSTLAWTFYAPATTTQVVFPALPPQLQNDIAGMLSWYTTSFFLVDVTGETRTETLRHVARDLGGWLQKTGTIPVGGVKLSRWDTP
jgi:hypothetical protein